MRFHSRLSAVFVVAIAIGLASSLAARAQQARFDVVSIKPCDANAPSAARGTGNAAPVSLDRIHMECYPLSTMIQYAYVSFAEGRFQPMQNVIGVTTEGGPS